MQRSHQEKAMNLIPSIVLAEPIVLSRAAGDGLEESAPPLHIAVVYEDTLSRGWALQTCAHAARLVPNLPVHTTWWKIRLLEDPQIFATAVQAAARADVVCVSLRAAEKVPAALSRWFDAFMTQRSANEGALLALVGVTPPARPHLGSTLEYLRAVAERGRLAFLPQEMEMLGRDDAPAQKSFRDWGINE